ncbi:hypothetical protein [Chryseobacterium daecheongense]|uniref:Lipoprotein n=2 Tax=Chryseobacterium daecheongense TaxID=192389 RepID=A0ABY2FTN7_9FLAO|nr:hypothetical protein [Chryseobacterium daecheongense]TDX91804.1 hypothetical protein BCF50_2943 [Chryseobacterium daecheongense]
MKNLKHILAILLLSVFLISCNDKSNMGNSGQNEIKENNFTSSNDAVNKGKADLISILKTNKEFNLNIDAAALERSKPEAPISVFDVNFEKLLRSDSIALASIAEESKKSQTPLVDNTKVVTVISTSKNEKGWQLDEITDNVRASDLTEIKGQFNNMNVPISVFEVPNINATIYEVNADGRKLYYTKYNGGSLRQPLSEGEILKQIRTDAQIFQRQFGDELKKGKLVK